MFYMKHKGKTLDIESDNVYTICPMCGKEHTVDLSDILSSGDADLYSTKVYCDTCSVVIAGYRQEIEANVGEIAQVAARFKVDPHVVENIVRSGLERGLTIRACLVGARLGLSSQSGGEELFTLEDLAAAIGGTVEDAKTLTEKEGIQPTKLTTLPGFEWLLHQEGKA